MGYTTDFTGKFLLNKKLDDKTHQFLVKFNESRRMKRNFSHLVNKNTGELYYGVEGEFFVDGTGSFGQDKDNTVTDSNHPPRTQPSLWCGWRPADDGTTIEWDGGEKFYEYREWIVYIIQNFLNPQGYVLNGNIGYQGEDTDDSGTLVIVDNVLYDNRFDKGILDLYTPNLCRSQLDVHVEATLLDDKGPRLLLESKSTQTQEN